MGFFLVIERELRVLARNPACCRVRFAANLGAVAILAICMFLATAAGLGSGNPGKLMFIVLTVYVAALVLVGGPFLTADTVARERREGTLGFLFLTDLSGAAVAMGKWVGASANAFLTLLAVAPVAALCLLFGGLGFGEFWRTELALLNLAFCATALGLFYSCFCKSGMNAGWLALMSLAVLAASAPLLAARKGLPVTSWLVLDPLSPVYSTANAKSAYFWRALGESHALAWALLAAGSWELHSGWRGEDALSRGPRRWIGRSVSAIGALLDGSKGLSRQPIAGNPIAWAIQRSRRDYLMTWATAGLSIAFMGANWAAGAKSYNQALFGFVTFFCCFPFLSWMALKSASFFSETRRSGDLELILCTTLPDAEALKGHTRGLYRLFFPPAIVVAIIWSATSAAFVSRMSGVMSALVFLYGFSLLAAVPALVWNGAYLALNTRKPAWAGLANVIIALLLPRLAFCVPDLFVWIVLFSIARFGCADGVRALLRSVDIHDRKPAIFVK
jgi:hypothetical protein